MAVPAFVRRHRSLHPLLGAARRVRAYAQQVTARGGRAHRIAARGGLAVGALPSRAVRAARRAHLDATLAALPSPVPEPRLVSVVLAPGAHIGRAPRGVTTEVVRAPEAGSGSLLCFLAATAEPLDDGWLAHLTGAVHGETVAAAPLLVHPAGSLHTSTSHDLQVSALGYDVVLLDDAPELRARGAGAAPRATGAVHPVDSGSAACFVVDRRAFDAAGGVDDGLNADAAIVDLCVRLRERGGRIVAVPSAIVADHRPVGASAELRDPFALRRREWAAVVARCGPALVRSVRAPDRPRIAITTAAPSAKVARRWGDWHFGSDLARALRRAGHDVRLQTADQADSIAGRSCDVHLVLRGLAPIGRTIGQRHVLWVISHPESLTTDEVDAADLVLVASERFATALRARTRTPVETFLQATDHHRFRPRPSDPRYAHPLVVVAKTRAVTRPMVADAVAVGLRPAIYGSGWEEFVDPSLVVADYVANEELPRVYASAGVLLNDHWDQMRTEGFVSNRIFDALACGTPVISDHMDEITALFGHAVPMFRNRDELRSLVEIALGDLDAARSRVEPGRRAVLDAHTFDHRAHALSDALARHGFFERAETP